MNISRRNFIKSAAALAALTAVPLLKISELERQIASGNVHNQIFYLTKPIVLSMTDVSITNCRFIAKADLPHWMIFKSTAERNRIMNCIFDSNGFTVGGLYDQA